MTTNPEPPTNVRFVYADGCEVPVDCIYAGDEIERVDGPLVRLHLWLALNPRDDLPARVLIDVLPARTSLRIAHAPIERPDDDER